MTLMVVRFVVVVVIGGGGGMFAPFVVGRVAAQVWFLVWPRERPV